MASRKSKRAKLATIAGEIARCKPCRRGGVGLPVPGEGSPNANIVFIGEAPGKNEARVGRPFIGGSGKILRKLIKGIGLRDEDFFITSPVHYLPKRGTPTAAAILHGREHTFRQLELINPKLVVLLGRVSCFAMLGKPCALAKEHGRVVTQDGRVYFLTFHPAAELHSNRFRGALARDFKKLKRVLKHVGAI